MSKLTLDEATTQYAWQLGRTDYPVYDQCPYSAGKSRNLYTAYWQGWRWARRKHGDEGRVPRSAA